MPRRKHLPTFAQEMQRWGKYAFEHQTALYEEIDAATTLTDEEKQAARKVVKDIMAAQPAFRKVWLDSQRPVMPPKP